MAGFIEVELPDGTIAEFPETMKHADIEAVLSKQYPVGTAAPTPPTANVREQEISDYEAAGGGFMNSLERGGRRLLETFDTGMQQVAQMRADRAAQDLGDAMPGSRREQRLRNKLDTSTAAAKSFEQNIRINQNAINALPQHPSLTRAMMRAQGEQGFMDKAGAVVGELADSPDKLGLARDLVGEQLPVMASTVAATRGLGALANAGRGGQMAAVGMGAGAGSFLNTYGANVAQYLQNGESITEARRKGAVRSAVQALTDAGTGAIVPIKIGGSQVINVPTQTAIQMLGGGGGEYLAALGVDETPEMEQVVLEGLLEAVGLPGDVIASISIRPERRAAMQEQQKAIEQEQRRAITSQPDSGRPIRQPDLTQQSQPINAGDGVARLPSPEQFPSDTIAVNSADDAWVISEGEKFMRDAQRAEMESLGNQSQRLRAESLPRFSLGEEKKGRYAAYTPVDESTAGFIDRMVRDAVRGEDGALEVDGQKIAVGDLRRVRQKLVDGAPLGRAEGRIATGLVGMAESARMDAAYKAIQANARHIEASRAPEAAARSVPMQEEAPAPQQAPFYERKPASAFTREEFAALADPNAVPADVSARLRGEGAGDYSAAVLDALENGKPIAGETAAAPEFQQLAEALESPARADMPLMAGLKAAGLVDEKGARTKRGDKALAGVKKPNVLLASGEGNPLLPKPAPVAAAPSEEKQDAPRKEYPGLNMPDMTTSDLRTLYRTRRKIEDAFIKDSTAKPADKLTDEQFSTLEEYAFDLEEEIGRREQAGEKTFEKKSGGDTLYSNPFFDPVQWKKLYEDVLRPVMGWTVGDANAWRNEWRALSEGLKGARSPLSVLGDAGKMLIYSNDGYLRAMGKPSVDRIADMLYAKTEPGKDAKAQTYGEAVEQYVTSNHNRLYRALKPFLADKTKINRVVYLVQHPQAISAQRSEMDRAAIDITRMLNANRQYLENAGLEVGQVNGYFPREYDTMTILQDEEGFLRAAARAYEITYGSEITHARAQEMANRWLNNLKLGDAGVRVENNDFVNIGGGAPSLNSLKPRTLAKEADDVLRPYLVQDPLEVLQIHYLKSAQRAEFNRRFGGERWAAHKAAMLAEDAGRAIPDVVKVIQSATGQIPNNVGATGRSAISWLKTFGILRFLPHSTLTSLSEIAMPAIRTGDARYFGKAFVDGFKLLSNRYDARETREIAEEVIGVMANAASDLVTSQRMGGMVDTRLPRHIQQKFFSRIALHQYTEATRGISTSAGMSYLSRLARDYVTPQRRRSSEIFLADLGIPASRAAEFSQWLAAQQDGRPTAKALRGEGEMERLYKTALGRFVDQTIMKPKGAEKPRYAQHPVGSLFYFLQSFAYSFSKNVLVRNARLAKEAATGKGLTVQDRLALAAPAFLLPSLFLVQLGLGSLRQELLEDPARKKKEPKDTYDAVVNSPYAKAASRAGYFGIADPLVNLATGVRYQRDPATGASGPIFGELSSGLASFVNLLVNNSENTNTAERNAARSLYNLGVMPVLNGVMSIVPGKALGVAGIQAVSRPATRDAFVSAIAGEKEEKPSASGAPATGRSRSRARSRGRGRSNR